MAPKFAYSITFVADMDKAIAFYRDTLGLTLKFQSPQWTEFSTGETSLALHPASKENLPGKCMLGFQVPDLAAFYKAMTAKGVKFPMPPTR